MYCVKCGTELDDDARFCIKCGVSVNDAADDLVPSQPSASKPMKTDAINEFQQAQSGQACGLPVMLKTGLMKHEAYIFVLTRHEIGVFLVGNQRYQEIQKEAAAEIEGGFLKKSLAMNAAFRDYTVKIAQMPMDQIMSMLPGSERIPLEAVKSLRIIEQEDSEGIKTGKYSVELRTDRKKMKGTLDRNINLRTLNKALKELLGRKYKHF